MNFNNLTKFLNYLTNTAGVPSVDLTIHKNGEEIYRHTGGYAYDEKYKYYNIYSVSKIITCTAALQLFEKGKYLLTEPLYEYIPEFKQMYVKKYFSSSEEGRLTSEGKRVTEGEAVYEITSAKKPILIKDLFTMSAGFDYNISSNEIKMLINETDGKFPTKMIIRALSQRPLAFEPGEHWQYSLCHDVLAAFIEVVSGMKFSAYLKKYIFDPLEMKDTGFDVTDKISEKMFPQYLYNDSLKKAEEVSKSNIYRLGIEYESGGAGLYSTVDDYIKFSDALANGGKGIISPKTIKLMSMNHLTSEQLCDFNWEQLNGYGYGLGVRTMMDPVKGGSLSAYGEFGWGGAAGAYTLIDTENKISVYYGQHMLNNLEAVIHPRIRNLVYSSILS